MNSVKSNHTRKNTRKTIFIFIGSRINISDTLRTRFIKEIADRHNVVVFLPEDIGRERPDTSIYPRLKNVSYHLIPVPMGVFWTLFHELRTAFLTRFNNTHTQWVEGLKKKRGNFRMLLWRGLAAVLPTSLLSTVFFTKIEMRFAPGFTHFKKFARKFNPDLVLVSFSGNAPLEVFATLWARRAGIPTAMYNPTWDKFTCYPKHVRQTDYVIVWNDHSKQQVLNYFVHSPERVFVGGALRFDHYFRDEPLPLSREEFLKSKGLDPKKKTVFFASGLKGMFHKDFPRAFIEWQKNNAFGELVNLFVRVHTLDPIEEYEEFTDIPNVHVERAGTVKQGEKIGGHKTEMNEADLINTKMTLMYCDVCVNINSTMSVEAMVFDKPVICAGFVPFHSELLYSDSYRPVVEHGAVRIAGSMEEMRENIEKYLDNPTQDRENRARAVEFAMGPTDGYSYKRIVDFIDEILDKENKR